MSDFTDFLKPSYDGGAVLKQERDQSSISVDELSRHLLSRDNFLERQKRIVPVLEREPLFNKKQQLNLSRPERYHLGLARAKALRRLVKKHGWDHEDYRMAEYLVDEMSPYHLHMTMFATTVREQGSDEQRKYWMPKIESWKILGAYAQTEMGHGSNVRGIELQAKYDLKSKEFIIHSPYLTASKWWNGTMGRTATHAIVVAQLLLPETRTSSLDGAIDGEVKYRSQGPHPFIVQIRDTETHQPLEGIAVGDIGPKYGYTSMDNGYMLFNNFRVPHNALLSRYAKVDLDTGAFKKEGHPGLVYGSLTNVRANIVMHSRLILARAVTIAVRYTSIRKQFRDRDAPGDNAPEMAVLDYPTVQIRILPLLATTFALHYTGEAMYNLYYDSREAIEKGDFSSIAELHSTSSGLKSLCTTYAANGIVASYLIKKMAGAVQSSSTQPADSTDDLFKQYLSRKNRKSPHDIIVNGRTDNDAIVEAFRWRAAHLSYQAYHARLVEKKPWNSLLIELHKLSNAYSEMILVVNFHEAILSSPLPFRTAETMAHLFQLYSLYTMDTDARSFSTTQAVTPSSLDALSGAILVLMTEKIRPHAVKLVDSWALPDFILDSALGRYDGRVYEDLFDRAHRQNPLNRTTFNVDWESDEIVKGSGDGGKHLLAKL
ncbi:hypothetical protein FKW77_003887 [Venturia effusa]|uniref:Acyl-coenzyme A oxidase n=1 Tax=Venturia effusa TaxID=50376 RepID=A0A517LR19_9PEZI|nr:hypothetical protein FKW77_003887 [Venturia effusa]